MSQSLAKIYVHLVFATKHRERCVQCEIQPDPHPHTREAKYHDGHGMRNARRTTFRFPVLVAVLFAFTSSIGFAPAAEPHYLSNTNLALLILPPPPEANSAEQRADLAEVLSAHKNLDSLDCSFATSERRISIFTFEPVIGSFFQTNRFLTTEAFFHRVLQDTDKAVDAGKEYWERPRPYIVDTNLFDGDMDRFAGSYPSGHATLATVFAVLLSELFPDNQEAILAKAREIGWHRVMLGKHYPTDIYAGRVLGQRIVQEMRRNRRFRMDFKEARMEILSWRRRNQPR